MVKMMIMVQMAIEFYLNFIQISGEPGPFTTAKNGQSFLNHMKTIIEINNVDSTSHFFYEKPKVLEGGRGCTSSAAHLPRSVKSSEGNRSIKHFPRWCKATKYLEGNSSEFLSER